METLVLILKWSADPDFIWSEDNVLLLSLVSRSLGIGEICVLLERGLL